jgi:hypothetical protein
MRRGLALVVVGCAFAACSSGTITNDAVPVPPGAKTAFTVADGPRSLSLLEDGDCIRLQIKARGRRYLSDARCPSLPFTSTLSVLEPEVQFNDRDVKVTKCPDLCGGPRPDVTLPAPLVWGRAAPEAGFVCVDGASGPVVIRPRSGGLVLAPVPGAPAGDPDAVMSFLPDGRFIGTPGPPSSVQPAGVDRCRAAGAPGRHPAESIAWPFAIDVAPDLFGSDAGLLVDTDTGYAPDGATLRLLADGSRIVLRLHPDTTALGVSREDDAASTARLRLPRVITDALADGGGCAVWRYTIVLHIDEHASRLTTRDNGRTCSSPPP